MSSKVTSTPVTSSTTVQARRRRDSSDDFGAGSLGSIGGSEVGSSVASNHSISHTKLESPAPPPVGATIIAPSPSTTITPVKPTATAVDATPLTKNTRDSKTAARDDDSNDGDKKPAASTKPITQSKELTKLPPSSMTTKPTVSAFAKKPPGGISSSNTTTGSVSSPPMSRRPFRKRKGSVDFTLSLDDAPDTPSGNDSLTKGNSSLVRSTVDALPSVDAVDSFPLMDGSTSSPRSSKLRSDSHSSSGFILERRRRSASGASLERLDALGEEAKLAAAKIKGGEREQYSLSLRKGSTSEHSKMSGHSSSHGTYTSQSHRMLLEAFMGGNDDDNESLVDSEAAEEAETNEFQREERLGSFDVRDRLGSFDVRDRLGSFDVRERFGSFDATHDHRLESFGVRRERLESWGGMSDLSIPVPDSTGTDSSLIGSGSGVGGHTSTVALAATIYSSLANDLTAAANPDCNESISSFLVNDEKIPTRINMNRDRLNSINSTASDPSLTQGPTAEDEIPSEIQKLVRAAMASVGDQLAEIAVAASEAVRDVEDQSELSSTASPMIGATSDTTSRAGSWTQRPRSGSLGLQVDYDAVAAALSAAEAAAGAIDLAAFAQSASASVSSKESSAKTGAKRKRPQLPIKKTSKKTKAANSKATSSSAKKAPQVNVKKEPQKKPISIELPPIPKSKLDERDMELIRERARAAAGYVPPSQQKLGDKHQGPPKKRLKLENPNTPNVKTTGGYATPKTSNSVATNRSIAMTPYSSAYSTPGSAKSAASKGQSSQKWDSMFESLLEFIEERRKEDAEELTEQETKEWVWDGNVPTTFKTKDGKALGRWVNNQRSAKSKGVLKDDREKRLIDAGLKWSVLASNSWNEMLEELRIYVNEQTKAGRQWDGNVPTNYRIKNKAGIAAPKCDDDDKNLGRWVNRQRSLYQAGKLRKDRQLALEKVGLKWSMLATTSWESMFETLCEYVAQKTKDGAEWDGNVPANYRTSDNPPRALGRWINRQRSAYGKDKIKTEYVDKLNRIGLKWSVHERRPLHSSPDPMPSSVASENYTSSPNAPSLAQSESGSNGKIVDRHPTKAAEQGKEKVEVNDQKDDVKPDKAVSSVKISKSSGEAKPTTSGESERESSSPKVTPAPSKAEDVNTKTALVSSKLEGKITNAVPTSEESEENETVKVEDSEAANAKDKPTNTSVSSQVEVNTTKTEGNKTTLSEESKTENGEDTTIKTASASS